MGSSTHGLDLYKYRWCCAKWSSWGVVVFWETTVGFGLKVLLGILVQLLLLMLSYMGGLWWIIPCTSKWLHTNIELQLDSTAVVKAIEGAHLGNSGGRRLGCRICSLLHEGWNVKIRHIYWKANRVVDALASLECRLIDVSLYDDPPNEIDQLLK
jgi:hypothetical protein